MTHQEHIARAALFMDENYPGWAEKVNMDTLQMIDVDSCVAGQNNLDWEAVGEQFAKQTGLDVEDAQGAFASWKHLWIEEIEKRTLAAV